MKVVYQGETKRLPELKTYGVLVKQTAKAFNLSEQDMVGIKFYYIDHEQDIISITNQGDLDEAQNVLNGVLKLVATRNIEEARAPLMESVIGRSNIIRNSDILNQSMSSIHSHQFNPNQEYSGTGQLNNIG